MTQNPFLYSAMIIATMMMVVYIIALIKRDYSVIDISWPLGFLFVSIFVLDWGGSWNEILVKLFVTVWSVRLCSYLFYRIMKHGPDKRYKELEYGWGQNHRVHAFFKIFVLQGFLMYWIAMPVTTASYVIEPNIILLIIGGAFWKIGFILESVADFQLYTFRQKPENKSKYLMTGLFSISRHPNYLGECLVWIGIGLLALPSPYWYLAILGPSILIAALYKFSGVPYAERNRKGARFEKYVETTGAIFPKIF
jgi:steroid 5-alpha reductase family enzyme